ncbi:MAG: hypothetical protein WKF78_14385 [Candidatus Limnocylindrales bacterium]
MPEAPLARFQRKHTVENGTGARALPIRIVVDPACTQIRSEAQDMVIDPPTETVQPEPAQLDPPSTPGTGPAVPALRSRTRHMLATRRLASPVLEERGLNASRRVGHPAGQEQ